MLIEIINNENITTVGISMVRFTLGILSVLQITQWYSVGTHWTLWQLTSHHLGQMVSTCVNLHGVILQYIWIWIGPWLGRLEIASQDWQVSYTVICRPQFFTDEHDGCTPDQHTARISPVVLFKNQDELCDHLVVSATSLFSHRVPNLGRFSATYRCNYDQQDLDVSYDLQLFLLLSTFQMQGFGWRYSWHLPRRFSRRTVQMVYS